MSRHAFVSLSALVSLAAWPASAQQASQPAIAAAPVAVTRPAAIQPTPRPAQAPAEVAPVLQRQDRTPARTDTGRPLGFSVVLVAGDLRAAAGGEDDVPAAARKALADMKDFLPYKSYRLLDAAWVLCCGPGRTMTRLRGPDGQEYELEITATKSPITRNAITFVLRDAAGTTTEELAEAQARVQDLERQLADEARAAQAAGQARSGSSARAATEAAEVRRQELVQQRRRVEQAKIRAVQVRGRSGATISAERPIINTSFAMDAGETVVVGTSRLSGGDRALIALLTAVPQKTAKTP